MAEPHQGKKNSSFQDEPIGDKMDFTLDPGTKRKTKVFDSGKLLKGTTAMAFIDPNAIHLVSDQRQIAADPQRQTTYVMNDGWKKLYNIDNDIIVTAAGSSERFLEFAETAFDVNRAAFGGVQAAERVYLVARVVLACIDDLEMRTGLTCLEDFIIAGYYFVQPQILRVRSRSLGGIEIETRVGYPVIIGSGKEYAMEFYHTHRHLQPQTLGETSIGAASIKDGFTGGHVQSVQIPIGGNETFYVDPPPSVLQLLERDLGEYRQLLQNALFFVCYQFPYDEDFEPILLQALTDRFPDSHTHIISRQNVPIRIMNFDSVISTMEAWQDVRNGISLELFPGCTIQLQFFEPIEKNIRILRGEEQRVV